MSTYLNSVKSRFDTYKILGERTFSQVSDEKLFWQFNDDCNSIATIVKHLWGNMLSRWTDFRTNDGEKEWRQRDEEFENDIKSREELLAKWNEGWKCLYDAIDTLNQEDLEKEIFIRSESLTIMDALNRQLAHYSYHVGQIVFLGKMISNEPWQSLSIAKGRSAEFNKQKFSKPETDK